MFDDDSYKYHGPNHGYHPYGDGQHHVMLGIDFQMIKGKEVTDTVRLIDLAPTIAEHLEWDNEEMEHLISSWKVRMKSQRDLYI